ncbi:MAG: hypothetical protein ACOX0A_05260 [Thermoguttaceae bacterium]|jgi:hypothetical protein
MSERPFFARFLTFLPGVVLTAVAFGFSEDLIGAEPPTSRISVKAAANTDLATQGRTTTGNAATRRVRQVDSDGLPPAEEERLELFEQARDAQNWLDPDKTQGLRQFVLDFARERRERWPEYPELNFAQGKLDNIRRLDSRRVVLYTDLPSSSSVDELPEVLEAAIPQLCEFFHADPAAFSDWKVEAFLMRDVDAFVRFRALEGNAQFLYGYSDRNRIYAKDQKVEYYNRFLLIHELVHTFMHSYFGDLQPRWFSEGAAEYIALHNWDRRKGLELAQIPVSASGYPGFGRLSQLQGILKTNRTPTILDILNFEPRHYRQTSTYAWSWAFVMFLHNSPKYKDVAEVLPYWMVAEKPNRLFVDAIGSRWAELEYDWADFLSSLDYSYDFAETAIKYPSNNGEFPSDAELIKGVVVAVDATKGWQATPVRLESGKTYRLTVGGRFNFYLEEAKRSFPFEGTGATVEYINGVPAGRLCAVVAPDPGEATFDEVYRLDSGEDSDDDPILRFDVFKSSRHTRFGIEGTENASGFSQAALSELALKARQTPASVESRYDFYNALYPWNTGFEFSSTSIQIEPEVSGTLYLRVNAFPRNLRRNKGRVMAQIKLRE